MFVSQIFQHQGIRVAQEAGSRGVAGDLVVEEHAPVIAVRHSQFSVGQRQTAEHFVHDFLVVVHQGVGLPFRFLALEQMEGQMGFAQFLHHDILVRSMEVIVVLQCIVVIQVFPDIQVLYGGLVIFRVDDRGVLGIIDMRVAVDGKCAKAFEPLWCQCVVRIETQGTRQDVGFPTVFFGFRVAVVTRGNAAFEFVIAFRLDHVVNISLLALAQFFVQEVRGVCQ